MKEAGARLGVALGVLLLMSVVKVSSAGPVSQDDPHPFLEGDGCLSCHEQTPAGKPGTGGAGTRLKKLLPVCLGCHPGEEDLHPVGVEPDFEVPTDLLLAVDGTVSCITCHRAHGERYGRHRWVSVSPLKRLFGGSGERYKTYYLRRANPSGELCLACHH